MRAKGILILVAAFVLNSFGPFPVQAEGIVVPLMPVPGTQVALTQAYVPAHIQGMTINPKEPFKFEFLIRRSDESLTDIEKKQEYKRLVKYFLAALTVPEKDQWVNLSPYEKNRIIEGNFGATEMGRDLLAQDYLLKQITSSLMYPESGLGKKFWDEIYKKASEQFGNVSMPVNMFNKVWIVPDEAVVYESKGTAYILKSRLKVMLEEDYLAVERNGSQPGDISQKKCPQAGCQAIEATKVKATEGSNLTQSIIKEIILPALEKEVNEGKNFAQLRQVYSGMILATWFKRSLKESILTKIYADKSKIEGTEYSKSIITLVPTRGHFSEEVSPSRLPSNEAVSMRAPEGSKLNDVETIYQQYLQSVKKGAFNYIKESVDPNGNSIPRKYFAGGFHADAAMVRIYDPATITPAVLRDVDFAQGVLESAEILLAPSRSIATEFGYIQDDLKEIIFDLASENFERNIEEYFEGFLDSGVNVFFRNEGVLRLKVEGIDWDRLEKSISGEDPAMLTLNLEMEINNFLEDEISDSSIKEKLMSSLMGAGVMNVRELLRRTIPEIQSLPSISQGSIDALNKLLGKYGLELECLLYQRIEELKARSQEEVKIEELLNLEYKFLGRVRNKIQHRLEDLRVNYVSQLLKMSKSRLMAKQGDYARFAETSFNALVAVIHKYGWKFSWEEQVSNSAMTSTRAMAIFAVIAVVGAVSAGLVNVDAQVEGRVWDGLRKEVSALINRRPIAVGDEGFFTGSTTIGSFDRRRVKVANIFKMDDFAWVVFVTFPDVQEFGVTARWSDTRNGGISGFNRNDKAMSSKSEWAYRLNQAEQYIDGSDWPAAQYLLEKAMHEMPDYLFLGMKLKSLIKKYENSLPSYWDRHTKQPLNKRNSAMISGDISEISDQSAPGGIDFNPSSMSLVIKRDGNGIPLPVSQQDLSQFSGIEGLDPVVLEIAPVLKDLPILLELRQKAAMLAIN